MHTFLFTDIEGSTQLFEHAGSAYTTALQQHFALLRTAFAAAGGREFRNSGDGLLAVFEDSRAAIECALECQRALGSAVWPREIETFRVRIGLHRGAAEWKDGTFWGLTMHLATRVLNAGHGGQIVCSREVFDDLPLVAREPLRDLGLYRLRGISAPVRIYEVGNTLPAAPPLRAPAAFNHRLPTPATRFFGRETELTEIEALLRPNHVSTEPTSRLITLHGPGGTGKSRLSLALAQRLRPAYSNAIWFAPLAEIRDAALLPELLRETLELPADPSTPALERVIEMLAEQPTLLILDNYEQLVPDGVDFVRTLLERLPELVLLVSSRVRLGLSAERVYDIAPLQLPTATTPAEEALHTPSLQLFIDRARAVRHSFTASGKNLRDTIEVCRRLEGIPLAIELAAARASVLTPGQMLSRLNHRLDFLVGGSRDTAQRHRTLRETVAWSFELLAPPLQDLFCRLAIFRGGWTLDAVEAIATEPAGDLFEQVRELESGSLIVSTETDGEMRYHMLEVIRDFAHEQLMASGKALETAARHHCYFCGLARDLAERHDEADRFRQIETENDNFRAVLAGEGPLDERVQLAVDLRDYWMVRGSLFQGREWCQRLLAENPDVRSRGSLANAIGILAWKAGNLAEARQFMEESMRIWVELNAEVRVAGMLNNLGIVAIDQGDLAAARDFYEQSLALHRRLGALSPLAAVLSNLGEFLVMTNALAEARAALEESLALQEKLGEKLAVANTLHNLAELHCKLGDGVKARGYLARSVQIRQAVASRENLPETWATLARIALREGDHARAAALFSAAEAAFTLLETEPTPAHSEQCGRDLEIVRAALGTDHFAQCWLAGGVWTLEQAMATDGAWIDRPDLLPLPIAV